MKYTKQLIDKSIRKKCDICGQEITEQEARDLEFEYSRTKRKTDIFVHKRCWDKLYG